MITYDDYDDDDDTLKKDYDDYSLFFFEMNPTKHIQTASQHFHFAIKKCF